MLTVTPTDIPAVKVVEPYALRRRPRLFRRDLEQEALRRARARLEFVQDNESLSARVGTVRGLHFQRHPNAQDKLVRALADARSTWRWICAGARSPTASMSRSSCRRKLPALLIPIGFAHGFCTLEPDTVVAYKVSGYYSGADDVGVAWDDPDLAIRWPVDPAQAALSDKDRRQPKFKELPTYFRLSRGVCDEDPRDRNAGAARDLDARARGRRNGGLRRPPRGGFRQSRDDRAGDPGGEARRRGQRRSYTAVDQAEKEPELAMAVNGAAAGAVAAAAARLGAPVIHISTDYVFDGKADRPYNEEDPTSPLGAYGSSKLKGEELALAANARCVVLRTAWVYSPFGKNFVRTMLRLAGTRDGARRRRRAGSDRRRMR